jgi:hypothetical protein
VVALERNWDGPRPDNVHLVPFVQQQLLLPACDLFVTHAGYAAAGFQRRILGLPGMDDLVSALVREAQR